MHDHPHDGFYPLSNDLVERYVPSAPGAFALAVRLASGAHHTFYTADAQDLQESLRRLTLGEWSEFPPYLMEYLERFQCYLSYYVFPTAAHAAEIEKMVRQTNDPVARLRVICAN